MNARSMIGFAASICIFSGFSDIRATAWEPLRAHPLNPYILEFRGEPTVLCTFAQHYSSAVNSSFDFGPYHDVLHRDGMNLTRVFLVGFVETNAMPTPLAPAPEDMIQPWPRNHSQGTALDGLGKWDFSTWDEAYFDRLRTLVGSCSDRGIVTELTFFSTFYTDAHWQSSPFNPANNVQGIGPASRYDAFRLVDAGLLAVQQAVVRRIVREVNEFDNLTFEIQNEPFWNEPNVKDDQEIAFHHTMLAVLRDEESILEHQHLVAHNFPKHAAALSSGFDVINEHYPVVPPNPVLAGAEVLLRDHYSRGRILALDETTTPSPLETRLESWMFLLGGGGIYNGLDIQHFVYSEDDESGDSELGRNYRRAVRNIGTYISNLHLVALRRDFSWLGEGIPDGVSVQAMANPGQQYVAYIHHGQRGAFYHYDPIDTTDHTLSLVVSLDAGTWRAVWTRPSDLTEIQAEDLIHSGGACALAPVSYQEDVALRIDRTGDGDTTPPPRPRALTAAARADGSIFLAWNPVQAADLASCFIYRAGHTPVTINEDHLIATAPASDSSFSDTLTTEGVTYHYAVAAVDSTGNESAASSEATATSARWSLPYGGVPWSVPGIIEAEDFDSGGQEIAYNDLTPSGTGAPCREDEAVDLESTTDEGGGFRIVETQPGEWLKYTIQVAVPGGYIPEIRVANDSEGGAVHLEFDGADLTDGISIPETGGLDSWRTVTFPEVELPAGKHVLRLVMDNAASGGMVGAINWISLTAVPSAGPVGDAGLDQTVADLDGDGFEEVALDAGGSIEGDSPITSYAWFENGVASASGVNPRLILAIGEHLIRLVVTDEHGLQSNDDVRVTITARQFGNGSFEAGYEGWNRGGNQTIGSIPGYLASDGSRCLAFNDGNRLPNGVLSQTFATIPGQLYQLSFDIGVIAYNTYSQQLQVEASGNAVLISQTFTMTGTGGGRTVWTGEILLFTADSPASTLTFRDRSGISTAIDLLLDNVRIVPRIARTLTVDSLPDNGVAIQVSPPDNSALSNGISRFNRAYQDACVVSLTAPSMAGGSRFQKWLNNGLDASSNPVISVTMDADRTLTAVYVENAPVITSQPAGVCAGIGGSAAFRVAAEGSGTLFYAWRFNGGIIPDTNGSSYTIDPIEERHAGIYDVVVSNAIGSVTSEGAALVVFTAGLLNGSFEDGYNGWSPGGNQSIGSVPGYPASDGSRCVAFNDANRPPDGNLSQTFATVPGQAYLLSFDMGVIAYNTYQQILQVEVAGGGGLAAETFTITGTGAGRTVWTGRKLSFIADSTASTLTFRDRSTVSSSLDLLLDNIRIGPHAARTLTIDSLPHRGIEVMASPPDDFGLGGGISRFSRSYQDASVVSLTAPSSVGGCHFQKWLSNGIEAGRNPVISVTMDADLTFTAVYEESPPVTNDLINGSFENGYDGWSPIGNQIIAGSPGYLPRDGTRCVVFNSSNRPPDGVLSQSFATIPGQIYQLRFFMGLIAYNAHPQVMQVDVAGTAVLASQTFTVTGTGGGSTVWVEKTMSFTADSQAGTLTFRDRSTVSTAIDLLLDDVRIVNQGTAIPVALRQATTPPVGRPPVAPAISRVQGGFKIHMFASDSGWYELQRSKDLSHWEPVSRLQLSEPGPLEFHDDHPDENRMFYRIALPRK